MELLCPECRAALSPSGRTAVCRTHGGQYELLFDRAAGLDDAPAVAAMQPDAPPSAKQCPECGAINHDVNANCLQCGHTFSLLDLAPRRPAVEPGTMCVQHASNEAVARCRVCRNPICAICDFELPGGLHVCPTCIETSNDQEVSPKRIVRAWIAIALAAFTTLMYVFIFSGALVRTFNANPNDEMVANVIGNLMLWPALAGIIFALLSFDRRLRNSAVIWTAVIWNGTLVGLFMLMMVVGLFVA